jgi:Na+-translocating ferredoxin:NAD+ oxidoreductase RnfD subunit
MSQTLELVDRQGMPGSTEKDPAIPGEVPARYTPGHLAGLRRFAIAITVLTILGHGFLGFEQSYAQPLVSLATAYSVQLLLEWASAWSERRRPRFAGGFGALVNFLLSAHITGLAIAMLLYFHDRLWLIAFASAAAISSKTVFRAQVGSATRHFFNPSNFGISVTLLLVPSVGLAMPWQFTAGLPGVGDWLFVGIVFVLGSYLNIRYTKRIAVVLGFVAGFAVQAVVRSLFFDAPFLATVMPATGIAAMIFTFYMVPDPATTPERSWAQVVFGASVALVYLLFMRLHIVFGLFFALTIVSAMRGVGLWAIAIAGKLRSSQGADREKLVPASPSV